MSLACWKHVRHGKHQFQKPAVFTFSGSRLAKLRTKHHEPDILSSSATGTLAEFGKPTGELLEQHFVCRGARTQFLKPLGECVLGIPPIKGLVIAKVFFRRQSLVANELGETKERFFSSFQDIESMGLPQSVRQFAMVWQAVIQGSDGVKRTILSVIKSFGTPEPVI